MNKLIIIVPSLWFLTCSSAPRKTLASIWDILMAILTKAIESFWPTLLFCKRQLFKIYLLLLRKKLWKIASAPMGVLQPPVPLQVLCTQTKTKAVIAAVFIKTKTKPVSFKNREKAVVEAGRVVPFLFLHVSEYFDIRKWGQWRGRVEWHWGRSKDQY